MPRRCYLIETLIVLLHLGVGQAVVPLVPGPAHAVGLPSHVQVVVAGGLCHDHPLRAGGVPFAGHRLLPVMDQLPGTQQPHQEEQSERE